MVINREARAMGYANKYHPLKSLSPGKKKLLFSLDNNIVQSTKASEYEGHLVFLSIISGIVLSIATVLYWNLEGLVGFIVWFIIIVPVIFICFIANMIIFELFGL